MNRGFFPDLAFASVCYVVAGSASEAGRPIELCVRADDMGHSWT